MLLPEIEGESRWLLRDFDARKAPGARAVVAKHLGDGAIITYAIKGPHDAELSTLRGQRVILVRRGLAPVRLRWLLFHEVSEWHLGRLGLRDGIEDAAELLAACLVAPRLAFGHQVERVGRRWPELAHAFTTSPTCVALRWLETRDEPGAVWTPAKSRARGPERGWHDATTIRRLAHAALLPAELHREQLERRRVLLVEQTAA